MTSEAERAVREALERVTPGGFRRSEDIAAIFNHAPALLAEIERLREQDQTWVDRVVHYRNLAIGLGARPEQMLDAHARKLAEEGWVLDLDPGRDAADAWAEAERWEAEAVKLQDRLAVADAARRGMARQAEIERERLRQAEIEAAGLREVNERLRGIMDRCHDAFEEDRGSDDDTIPEGIAAWRAAAKAKAEEVEWMRRERTEARARAESAERRLVELAEAAEALPWVEIDSSTPGLRFCGVRSFSDETSRLWIALRRAREDGDE